MAERRGVRRVGMRVGGLVVGFGGERKWSVRIVVKRRIESSERRRDVDMARRDKERYGLEWRRAASARFVKGSASMFGRVRDM